MLSLNQPFGGVNLGLADTYKAQTEQAELAKYMTDEQYKNLMAVQDNTNNLALQRQAASAAASAPQLRFNAEGFADGVGNGIGNYYAMKGYKQQERAYQDLIQQERAAQTQKRELILNKINAEKERTLGQQGLIEQKRPDLAPLYQYGTPEQRNQIMTKEIGLGYAPAEGTAEGEKQVNKGRAINTAVSQMPPVERNGMPIPAQVDARRNIMGFAPTTTVDVNKEVLGNKQAAANLKESENKLSVQPTQLQQDIELKNLEIAIKQIDAQFADQEKQLNIKREQLAHRQGSLDYKKALEDYKRFDQGRQLFKQMQEDGSLESNDPAKQAQLQAQFGIYGIKYNPPSSSFQTIKKKDGTIYMLDKNSGQIGKLEKDGTVKTWQDLQY
ncbi:MAG: hypothetical protein K0Q50_721 [Vampirovibrio sp.]|jgi:hypothetical protein|nr:hypothetical protein [Vampirovibrio sp.]